MGQRGIIAARSLRRRIPPIPKTVFILALALWAVPAYLPAGEIRIEPQLLIARLPGRAAYRGELTVRNDTGQTLRLWVEPEYWSGTLKHSPLRSWLKLSAERLEIPPRRKRTLRIDFAMPRELRGECVVMIFLASHSPGAAIDIVTRVGIPLYICERSTEVVEASVSGFSASLDAERRHPALRLEVVNRGNVHVVPFGAVLLKRDGRICGQREVKFDKPVFPDQTGQLEVSFPKGTLPAGEYQAELRMFLDSLYPRNMRKGLRMISAHCSLSMP